jgi:S1-C subfamily serine protease
MSDLPSEQKKNRLHRFRSWMKRAPLFLAGVIMTVAGVVVYHFIFPYPQPLTTSQVDAAISSAMASATPPPAISDQVYQAILPSLVVVQTRSRLSGGGAEDGLGSGVIINASGEILTCLHVVNDVDSITVTFYDGTQSSAQMMSSSPQSDIAVLQTAQLPAQVVPAVLGDLHAMRVGDEAYVVGNPFGLYQSMSSGIISGFGRDFQSPLGNQTLHGLIQVDTAINPGNSGGPLLNRYGQVIGIVEGIVNPVGQDFFVGIGFAVPIDVAGAAAGLPPD